MGNRAVIVSKEVFNAGEGPCVYLHWNGGLDSVKPLLDFTKEINKGKFSIKKLFEIAKVVFHSAYYENYKTTDKNNWDNGTYVIDQNYEIVAREFMEGREQQEHKYEEMYKHIEEDYNEYLETMKLIDKIEAAKELKVNIEEQFLGEEQW